VGSADHTELPIWLVDRRVDLRHSALVSDGVHMTEPSPRWLRYAQVLLGWFSVVGMAVSMFMLYGFLGPGKFDQNLSEAGYVVGMICVGVVAVIAAVFAGRLSRRLERPSAEAPAGWYASPGQTSLVRWWDGERWTAHQASDTND
jgi:hypothetical protein